MTVARAATGAAQPRSEGAQERALGRRLRASCGIVELHETREHGVVVGATLDRERALARRRQHRVRRRATPTTSCSRPSRRMPAAASSAASYSPARDLPNPRVDVSPDRADLEIAAERPQLGGAAQAARPDDGAFREGPPASRRPARRGSRVRPRAASPRPRRHPRRPPSGRSFSECTARSISPSRSARSSSSVKSPLPPISGSGSPLACVRSPAVEITWVSHARSGQVPVSSPMTESVCARASAEARVPRMTAACRGGALTDRSGRRGRTGRARRRRPRPRSRRRLARARARSGRGAAA